MRPNGWCAEKHHNKLYAVGVVDQLPAVEEQAEDEFEGYIVKPISRENVCAQLKELLLTPSEERRPTVVVLDDDADALMAVEHTLEIRGFDVSTYSDPGEALERIRSDRTTS